MSELMSKYPPLRRDRESIKIIHIYANMPILWGKRSDLAASVPKDDFVAYRFNPILIFVRYFGPYILRGRLKHIYPIKLAFVRTKLHVTTQL